MINIKQAALENDLHEKIGKSIRGKNCRQLQKAHIVNAGVFYYEFLSCL